MKTATVVNDSTTNKLTRCERNSLLSLFSLFCQRVLGRFIAAKIKSLNLQFVRVVQVATAGMNAPLLQTLVARINRRVFVGLCLMGVVAPLASCFYMLFERGAYDATWYYVNYFHLFLTLAPSLSLMASLIGVWFLFPYRSPRGYALAVPAGFTIGKILWLIQCTSNADFYSVVPASFVLIGVLISVFLFIASDWLVHNVFHREHAFERRLGTIYNGLPYMSGDEVKDVIKQYVEEKQSFQKQF